MLKGQKPSKKAEHLRWQRLLPAFNVKYRGFKAGPNLGFKTHHVNGSKPCRSEITNGELPCNRCQEGMRLGFTGYLPYWSEEGQKMVVLYGADFEDLITEIPFGTPIEIRKGNHPNAPVVIKQSNWATFPCPFIRGLRIQADIGPWCLQLWEDFELQTKFGMVPQVIPIPVSDDDVSPQLRGSFRSPEVPLMRELADLDQCERANRLKLPLQKTRQSANGKGHKP